jgi:hypothetical protein
MLFGWLSGSGQIRPHNIELGSRSFNLDGMDFFGAASPQGFFLADVRAAELKSKFSQNVSIVSLNGYSPVMASHDNKLAEEFYNRTNSILVGQYPINIAFISSVQPEMQNYRGRVSFNLPKDYFSHSCISQLKDIEDLMSVKFNERCSYAFGYQIFEAIAATLEDLNKILDSGCNITSQDEEAIYRAKGYNVFDIPGKPVIGIVGARQIENSKRSCPIVIDSSRVWAEDKPLPNYFFEGSDWMTISARYVFTSGFIPLSTRVHLESTMLSEKSCDLGVHVHIPNSKYGTPLEKVYIKIFVLDKGYFSSEYSAQKGSLGYLRRQFDYGVYNNNNVTEWIFKFKNHKEFITTYLVNDPKFIYSQNAAFVGLVCGFADSFLRDMQFLANITILQQGVKESIWAFSNYVPQVYIGNGDEANAELAFRTYIQEVIKASDVGSFGNDFTDIGQAITIFYELIVKSLADQWDKMQFRDSSFDFGYASGESVYVALGIKALIVGAGKGILALSKGVNKSLLTATNSVKNSVTGEKVYAALRNTSLILEPTEVLSMLNNKWWAKCLYRKKAWSNQLTPELTTLVNEFKFSFKNHGPKLGDFGPSPLGKYFDETMEAIIKTGWNNGNFTGLSDEVAQVLNSLRSEYDLLIKPKVSINGRTPEPDLLFIRKNSNGTLNYDDAIFIDNKYHIETKFTGAQQEIATAVKSPAGHANVVTTNSFTTLNGEIVQINQIIKVKEVRVFSIDDFANLIVKTF